MCCTYSAARKASRVSRIKLALKCVRSETQLDSAGRHPRSEAASPSNANAYKQNHEGENCQRRPRASSSRPRRHDYDYNDKRYVSHRRLANTTTIGIKLATKVAYVRGRHLPLFRLSGPRQLKQPRQPTFLI